MQSTSHCETRKLLTKPAAFALFCVVLSCGKPTGNAAQSSSVISTAQAAPAAAAAPSKVDVSGQRMAYDLLANR
ncbi:MAG TPA: hypothetical protein VIM14_11850, partial [Polyangia bacterium]